MRRNERVRQQLIPRRKLTGTLITLVLSFVCSHNRAFDEHACGAEERNGQRSLREEQLRRRCEQLNKSESDLKSEKKK